MMIMTTQSNKHKVFLAISLGLAVICTSILGAGIKQWYADWQLANIPVKSSANILHQVQEINLKQLSEAHLFGQSPNGDVPISNLQFRLTGIVAANDRQGQNSKAYISVSGESSKIFQIGDQLPYGVKIYAIKKNAVILSKDGQFEKLPLPRQTLEFKPGNTL